MAKVVPAAIGFALGLMAVVAPSYAQKPYPDRNVRIVVPFAAGGGVDAFARLLAQKLQEKSGGVSVVVENRAGSNGTVGGANVLQAAPDGSTLLFSASTHTMARHVMSKAPYDPVTDFSAIARVGQAPLLIVMAPKLAPTTLTEVVAEAKRDPASWTAAAAALGAPGHIAEIAFAKLGGLQLTILPYRGTAPALNDVAGGHVQLLIDSMATLLPLAKSGGVKALAITVAKRSALAPEIPTAAESGMPGLDISSWYGVWGPKGMAQDLTGQINAAFTTATLELAKDGKLAALGFEPVTESPEEFAKFIAADVARSAELLQSVNFKPE